jgi:signal transduction histidine kinase
MKERHGETSKNSLASRLSARRQEILTAYEQRLKEISSSFVSEEVIRYQVMAQAEETFDEVVANLSDGGNSHGNHGRLFSKKNGMSRASSGVHPADSVQAAGEFFMIFLSDILAYLDVDESAPIVSATMALHRSIIAMISAAGTAHSEYLAGKFHRAQTDERNLLARNLHDQVGYAISSSYRQLELLSMQRETGTSDTHAMHIRVDSAMRALSQGMENIRQLTVDLRLAEPLHNLEEALLDYVASAEEGSIHTSITVTGDESWASDHVRAEVFLVIREAMRNSMRHARPRKISTKIDISPHELRASVEDDGRGFRAGEVTGAPNNGSGIRSMRERAELLGGVFWLSSIPGKGTRVEIFIPSEKGLVRDR